MLSGLVFCSSSLPTRSTEPVSSSQAILRRSLVQLLKRTMKDSCNEGMRKRFLGVHLWQIFVTTKNYLAFFPIYLSLLLTRFRGMIQVSFYQCNTFERTILAEAIFERLFADEKWIQAAYEYVIFIYAK